MAKNFFAAAVCVLLVACGGGGSPAIAPAPSAPPTTPPPTSPMTAASGVLVDDASGMALGGVPVGLAPWTPAATPMPETTTAPDGTFAFTAPNGHYLLVIGSNTIGGTTQATIHDNVTLSGGTQVLKAPILPAFPQVTVPVWETNGDYRLATLNTSTEVPCVQAFNAFRTSNNVPNIVVDEWLVENTRAANMWFGVGSPLPVPINSGLLTSFEGTSGGAIGALCVNALLPSTASQGADARVLWYAGALSPEAPLGGPAQDSGTEEYPFDPRAFSDPAGVWP